jgi:hypothetical protein
MAVVLARKGRPASAVRQGEIVEEIVDNLNPWKGRRSRNAVSAEVKHAVSWLLDYIPLESKLFDQKQNRNHAKKLDHALSKIEPLLVSAPGALGSLLFSPPIPRPLKLPFKSIEQIEHEYSARFNSFIAELRRLREICSRAIAPGIGHHPNRDAATSTCAHFAGCLMRMLSERKITGTKDGAFRTIASLLYEAVSGQKDIDLKRACDDWLRNERERGTDPPR